MRQFRWFIIHQTVISNINGSWQAKATEWKTTTKAGEKRRQLPITIDSERKGQWLNTLFFVKLFSVPFRLPWNLPPFPLPDSITLVPHNIPFSDSARNLGFILVLKLSMRKACHKNVTLLISSLNALVRSAGFSLKTQPKILLLPISPHGLTTANVSSWVHLILSSNLFRKF